MFEKTATDRSADVDADTGLAAYDPYDLWALPGGVRIRKAYYAGELLGYCGAVAFGVTDWLAPNVGRRVLKVPKRLHPITAGLLALCDLRGGVEGSRSDVEQFWMKKFRDLATTPNGRPYWAWGLGFSWMSKNGLYGPEVPFVTHTPYVMEALSLMDSEEAREMMDGTWEFLESLLVMEESQTELALSYAPVREPRIVVNANSYAALAYALHAGKGRSEAVSRALRLVTWIKNQQAENGSWWYYADSAPGNFVDCFHSCFVVKNLLKVSKIVPEAQIVCEESIRRGWAYIREHFFDEDVGLCRRFIVRDIRDPYVWDLYDQAEFLGLMMDFGLLREAQVFRDTVHKKFKCGSDWFARIDIFGRRWGRNFLRWGIVPFRYQEARLASAIKSAPQESLNRSILEGLPL